MQVLNVPADVKETKLLYPKFIFVVPVIIGLLKVCDAFHVLLELNKLDGKFLNGNVNQVGTSEDLVACLQNNMISTRDLAVA